MRGPTWGSRCPVHQRVSWNQLHVSKQSGQHGTSPHVIGSVLPGSRGGGKQCLKSNTPRQHTKMEGRIWLQCCTSYPPVLSPNGRPILKADSIHLRKYTVTIELREQALAQSCIKWLKLFLLSFQITFCKWPYSSVWFYFCPWCNVRGKNILSTCRTKTSS